MTPVNAPDAPQPGGGYSQAALVEQGKSLLFVSGQIPVDAAGEVPADFAAQCRLVWRNIAAQLAAAGMDLSHLVKVTTFLSDRRYREENSAIRRETLDGHLPALTVIVCDIYDPQWLLEIEAVAAK
ncbi:RidA family protein [Sphingomonas sp.]|uniref:RidA family protein n=1 Tax=Sphingomonas sp. TaxID=28214 RepID=UPI0031D61E2B